MNTTTVYNDSLRMVQVFDDNRALLSSRAYTPAENAEANARAVTAAEDAAREAARVAVKAIVADLKLEKDRVQPIIDTGSGDLLKLARAIKRVADAAIDLAKLVG